MSLYDMFMNSDLVTKIVLISLLIASLWSWAIIFEKLSTFNFLKTKADDFEEEFWSGKPIDDIYDSVSGAPSDPMRAIFATGMKEWMSAKKKNSHSKDIISTIDRVMSVTLAREMTRIEKNLMFLASTSSVAPFLGLFGTVWGIMNAFSAIANSKNTSLAVVAPGISEALFTTALGLIAAIPATLAYNKFSTDLSRYAERLENFAHELSAILSRHTK
ncbi:MAG: protein TolQ [Alphaproteobacteria bacterium]|nr:protein TolQ [Alphaproteobacteria bacterium]MCV6599383.1 protein TolQ [Alphaproteobacteria bacterium]